MTKKFLHVGCGRLTKANSTPEFQKKEWIETRLDIDESVTPDIISSITDMSVVDSDSFEYLSCYYCLLRLVATPANILLQSGVTVVLPPFCEIPSRLREQMIPVVPHP